MLKIKLKLKPGPLFNIGKYFCYTTSIPKHAYRIVGVRGKTSYGDDVYDIIYEGDIYEGILGEYNVIMNREDIPPEYEIYD